HFTWRWLFFVNLPIAVLTLVVIWFFMHVPNERRKHAIDVWGSVTLSLAIAATLLATVWGGVQYPWSSWQIVGLYSAAGVLLATFNVNTSNQQVIVAMILLGLGLGACMQTYVLVVQNSVSRQDMAVATSATQLSRSIGAAIGLAILGTLLTQGMASSMARYLPASALHRLQSSGGGATATAVFDPAKL